MVHCPFIMVKRGRGRPRKVKKLDEYTLSELRDMPMGSMMKLFLGGIVGKKSVVISAVSTKSDSTHKESSKENVKKNEATDESVIADLMGMTLEKKADYLADALMGYLKKTK